MRTGEHVAKSKRFEASMLKLDLADDYEVIIWARIHICTHLINAALHARGATPKNWDINHTWNLEDFPDQAHLAATLDQEFRRALQGLDVFENIRLSHGRGPGPYGRQVLAISQEALDEVMEFCYRTVGEVR